MSFAMAFLRVPVQLRQQTGALPVGNSLGIVMGKRAVRWNMCAASARRWRTAFLQIGCARSLLRRQSERRRRKNAAISLPIDVKSWSIDPFMGTGIAAESGLLSEKTRLYERPGEGETQVGVGNFRLSARSA